MGVIIIESRLLNVTHKLPGRIRKLGYAGKLVILDRPHALLDGYQSGVVITTDAVETAVACLRNGVWVKVCYEAGYGPDAGIGLIELTDITRLANQYANQVPQQVDYGLKPYGYLDVVKAIDILSEYVTRGSSE